MRTTSAILAAAVLVLLVASPAAAQRGGLGGGNTGVFKSRVQPHWFDDGKRFWYSNDVARGSREYILVDAEKGTREKAFDHERLAAALQKVLDTEVRADRLPLVQIEFKTADNAMIFRSGAKDWRCDLATYELSEVKDRPQPPAVPRGPRGGIRGAARGERSEDSGAETEVTFVNRTAGEVELFWLNAGQRQSYGKLAAGERKSQRSFAGHAWEVVDASGKTLNSFVAEAAAATFEVTSQAAQQEGAANQQQPQRGRRGGGGGGGGAAGGFRGRGGPARSADGKWTASIVEHNIVLRSADGKETRLTTDGREGLAYGQLDFSPTRPRWSPSRSSPASRSRSTWSRPRRPPAAGPCCIRGTMPCPATNSRPTSCACSTPSSRSRSSARSSGSTSARRESAGTRRAIPSPINRSIAATSDSA